MTRGSTIGHEPDSLAWMTHVEIPQPLIEGLRAASHVTFLTGAGLSAESGLATFRGKQAGLWQDVNPMEVATLDAFERDPAFVWGWYEWRRKKAMQAQPNKGHLAITALQRKLKQLTLVTQNVDDLHERAGSHFVRHLHGTLQHPRCAGCGRLHEFPKGVPDEPEGGRNLRRLGARNATRSFARAWSGSANRFRSGNGKRRSARRVNAMYFSASEPQDWSSRRPRWCTSPVRRARSPCRSTRRAQGSRIGSRMIFADPPGSFSRS